MPNYRGAFVPGGSFFFTLVTKRRARLFAEARGRNLFGSMKTASASLSQCAIRAESDLRQAEPG